MAISALLVCLAAVFASAETAIFSLSAIRLRELVDKGAAGAKTVKRLLTDARGLLSALMVANNVVNITLTALITALALGAWGATRGSDFAELMATLITTIVLLAFAEVTPKAVAAHDPEGIAFRIARPIAFVVWLLTPVTAVVNALTGWIVGLIGGRDTTPTVSVTEGVIQTAVSVGAEAGAFDGEEQAMIKGVFATDDTPVARAMVPRQRIVAVEADAPLEEVARVIIGSGLSRLPVFRGDIDHIIGIVYAKDLFVRLRHRAGDADSASAASILRPPVFVRDSGKVRSLINDMQDQGTQLAIVRGADERVIGLITLEDLLEEVVGDIEDEHDRIAAASTVNAVPECLAVPSRACGPAKPIASAPVKGVPMQ